MWAGATNRSLTTGVPVITTGSLPVGTQNQTYSFAMSVTGVNGPVAWSILGGLPLPAGMSFSTSGIFAGTPTVAVASQALTIAVVDSFFKIATVTLNLSIHSTLAITTTSPLPGATVGSAYSVQMVAAGGTPPYSWAYFSAPTPDPTAPTISGGGLISWTPSASETETLSIKVTDSASPPTTVQGTFVAAVSSASGSLVIQHGILTTINGSGFGTRPNYNTGGWTWKGQTYMHYMWCDFSEVVPPTPSGNTNTDWINWKSAGLNGMYPVFSPPSGAVPLAAPRSFALDNAGVVTGGPSFGGFMWNRGPNTASAQDRNGGLQLTISGTPTGVSNANTSYPGEYVSYKYQSQGGVETTQGNEKSFRRSWAFNSVSPPPDLEFIWYITNSATNAVAEVTYQWGPPVQAETGGANLFALHNQVNFVSQFNRIQMVTDASGNLQFSCNANPAVAWNQSGLPAPISILPIALPTPWNWSNSTTFNVNDLSIQALVTFCSESAINAAYNQLITDIYFDFTPARVEVTDGTFSEPQILLGWADNQIQFLGNQGQLAAGPGTANVYNAANAIIQSFPATIGLFDYYVSPTGNDANPGTLASPWAISSLRVVSSNFSKINGTGKNIGFMPGTYDVSPYVGTQESNGALQFPGGTSLKPNLYASCDATGKYSARTATLDMKGASGLYGGHVASVGSFNGPLIAHVGTSPTVSYTVGNCIIDGLKLTGFSYKGIRVGGQSSTDGPYITAPVIVRNCELFGGNHNAGDYSDNSAAIWMDGAQTAQFTVTNNYIHDNVGTSGAASGDHINAIICWGFGAINNGTVIQYNTCVNSGNIYGKEGGNEGVTIQYNYIDESMYTAAACGIQDFTGLPNTGLTAPSTIRNNIVLMHGGTAGSRECLGGISTLNGITTGWQTPVQIYNNTVINTAGAGALVGFTQCQPSSAALGGLKYYNNIYVNQGSAGSLNGWGNYRTNPQALALQDFNLNPASGVTWVLSQNSSPGTQIPGGSYSSYAAFAAGLSANGGIANAEANSITGVPTFTATGSASAKWQLTGASIGHAAGRVGGVSTGAAIDMGAWGGTDVNTGSAISQIGCSFAP